MRSRSRSRDELCCVPICQHIERRLSHERSWSSRSTGQRGPEPRFGGIEVTRRTNARVVTGLAIWMLAGCNLVLGIDEVSSANGPDSGQQVSAATADPDAGIPGDAHDADDAGKPR